MGNYQLSQKKMRKILFHVSKLFYIRILKSCYMVKLGQLQRGDIVMVNDEGLMREGTVGQTSGVEHMALVNNGVQSFWYEPQERFPVAFDEAQLMKFGFSKEPLDGSA